MDLHCQGPMGCRTYGVSGSSPIHLNLPLVHQSVPLHVLLYGGFLKFGGTPNWVVYFMENHFKMGDLGVPPWLRKHPYLFGKKHMRSSFSCFEQHLRDHPLHPQKLTLPTGLWSGSPRKMGRGWLAALCSWPLHRFALGLRAAAFEGGPGGATSGGTGRNQLQFPFIKCQGKIELVFWNGFHLISPLLSFFGWVCYT